MNFDPKVIGSLNLPKYPRLNVGTTIVNINDSFRFQTTSFLSTLKGKQIEKNLRERGYDKRQIVATSSNGGGSLDFHQVLSWYIWYANEHSIQKADRVLKKFDSGSEYKGILALWITGINVQKILNLGNGYYLYPITEMPLSSDRERFRTEAPQMLFDFPRAAIVKETKNIKAGLNFSMVEPPEDPFKETNNKIYNDLLSMSRLINLINPVRSYPFMQSFYPVDCPVSFGGGGGRLFQPYRFGENPTDFGLKEAGKLKRLVQSLEKLQLPERKLIEKAMLRLLSAKQWQDIENKFLDLSIALESVLLSQNSNHDQLSLSFRLHGALLLGGDMENRKKNEDMLHEIYTHRSAVAHGGSLAQKKRRKYTKNNEQALEIIFPEFEILAEEIFIKFIEDGIPDWRQLKLMGKS